MGDHRKVIDRVIKVSIFQMSQTKNSPVATVRYTEYDEDAKPVKVNQVDYHDPVYFHSQVLEAVGYGLDVSIFTPFCIRSLEKKLDNWTN